MSGAGRAGAALLEARVEPVGPVAVTGTPRNASPWLLLRAFYCGVVHALTTP